MLIYIIKNNRLETFTLPLEVSGNYWITDTDENNVKRNLINMEEYNGNWKLTCNYNFDLYVNGELQNEIIAKADTFYFVKNHFSDEIITIFCTKIYNELNYYTVAENSEILIGREVKCQIIYNNNLISLDHAKLIYSNNKWRLVNLDPANKTYVNGFIVEDEIVEHGAVIFIMGLRIIPIGNTLIINNPANSVNVSLEKKEINNYVNEEIIADDDANVTVYQKADYFNRAPRFRSKIESFEIKIDDPPAKEKEDSTPAIIVVGPMITMSMTAVVTLYMGINRAVEQKSGINSALPAIIMGIAMIGSMLIWPLITKSYNKHKSRKNERKRKNKYEAYIKEKEHEILNKVTEQRQILNENFPSLEECSAIIMNKANKLWERKADEDDFLKVRLGLGTVPLDMNISFPEEKFSLENDELNELIKNLVNESQDITGAPVTLSLIEKKLVGVIGQYDLTSEFVRGILLQLITYYSADILKIVILTNEHSASKWEPFKIIAHNWDNEKNTRFFATNSDEIRDIILYLEKEYTLRNQEEQNKQITPYYLIINDDYKAIAEYNFTRKLLKNNLNLGYSMVIINDKLSNLPNECNCFININKETSGLIENELVSNKQKEFIAEFPSNININDACLLLANIPINIEAKSKGLPDSYGLLELYNIGKMEQLNALNRWKSNDPTISLSAPIGIDENGEVFKIDLHEKFHGPHGLVAGTTGSGKSEWIITFILSMAINYSPNEVSFVLIDYKGGGLALAFENKELGIRLPHIAGTITNLDANELNRSLASIESELKRRQREFNKARDISGESTIDIYKYQRLYREGIVDKPISHLFIISDEFAELKSQQPEFMDQLVSTARIGRSLGVHLILATQKPSGVVNDQILSNSRFKVCLKVQDAADSKDMIGVPDAANLKQAGRFYLLVGYNDFFAMGQAAYCGMPYIPSEKIMKKVDTNLLFINNTGQVIKSVDDIIKQDTNQKNGEVLLNVVKYLTSIADKENIKVNQLWLDRIPNKIFLNELIQKYNYQKENFIINPVIGEYDNPSNQSQHLLTLPLSKEGNTIIYGMTGAGKENLLATIVYSCITTYSSSELNMYIVDCGAETLSIFKNAPQIGDVLLQNDNEKIDRLFKMIIDIMNKRKKLFVEYGGTLTAYNNQNNNKLPSILILINNYETFAENYEVLEDSLIKITRECKKYGIYFITTATSASAMRFKLKQNFNQNLVLQMIDPYDYSTILGNVHKMVPSDNKGRGLVKLDEVYEFQGASICPSDNFLQVVKNTCLKLNESLKIKAKRIPSLPDKITIKELNVDNYNLENIPLGINKNTLETSTFDFKNNYITTISTSSVSNAKNFINGLIQVIDSVDNTKLMIFDLHRFLNISITKNMIYSDKNYDDVLEQLITFIKDKIDIYEENNYDNSILKEYSNLCVIIIGLDELFNRINSEIKEKFIKTLKEAKVLNLISFIIVDSSDNLKKYQYDEWFKLCLKNNNGIWIGNNIAEQNIIKLNKVSRELYENIENDFGYIIWEKEQVLVKFIQAQKDESVEELEF